MEIQKELIEATKNLYQENGNENSRKLQNNTGTLTGWFHISNTVYNIIRKYTKHMEDKRQRNLEESEKRIPIIEWVAW